MEKFKINQLLETRSICDYNCIFRAEVLKRTDKTVTIICDGKIITRRIKVCDGVEFIYPFGKYSMAPIFRAG